MNSASMDLSSLPATITAIGTLVAAIGALYLSYRNNQKANDAKVAASVAAAAAATASESAEAAKREIVITRDGVFEVGKQIDGRLSELLKVTKDSALAEGRLLGRAEMSPALPAAVSAVPAVTLPVSSPAPEPPGRPPMAPPGPIEVRVVQDPGDPAVRVKDVRQ